MSKDRARAIFTNDAECDDMNTLVHLLLYANDIDVEGIVLSSSVYHFAGDEARGIEPYRWAGARWMYDYLDAYEAVYPNLKVHDPAYPSPDRLRAVTCVGNVRTTGDMDEDTDGSELIRRAILSEDERPLYLLAGGGTNTIARALRRIECDWSDGPEWDEVYRRVCDKAIIYMIVTQDDTYAEYISKAWPDLAMLHCTNIRGIAFKFNEERDPVEALATLKGSWLKPNILDKGPLCAHYHTWFDGHAYPGETDEYQYGAHPELAGGTWQGLPAPDRYDMISEGDSPAFLHLIDTGLRSLEDPTWGGWGGRFVSNPNPSFGEGLNYYESAIDDDRGLTLGSCYQLTRWLADVMNDFACRATWCVSPTFEKANHAPSMSVLEGRDVCARPGEKVVLHAVGHDPDGDELRFQWLRYHEADTCPVPADLTARGPEATLVVPADASAGETIHVIACVRDRDDGSPYMSAYQRVVITVA